MPDLAATLPGANALKAGPDGFSTQQIHHRKPVRIFTPTFLHLRSRYPDSYQSSGLREDSECFKIDELRTHLQHSQRRMASGEDSGSGGMSTWVVILIVIIVILAIAAVGLTM